MRFTVKAAAALLAALALSACGAGTEDPPEGSETATTEVAVSDGTLFTVEAPAGFTEDPAAAGTGYVVWAAAADEARLEISTIPPGTELPPGQPLTSGPDIDVHGVSVGGGHMNVTLDGPATLARYFLHLDDGNQTTLHWVDAIVEGQDADSVARAEELAAELARSIEPSNGVTLIP